MTHLTRLITLVLVAFLSGCGGGGDAGSPQVPVDPTAPTPAQTIRFSGPRGIAIDASGNLDVSDTEKYTIVRITPSGDVSSRTVTYMPVPQFTNVTKPYQLTRSPSGTLTVVATCGDLYRENVAGTFTQIGGLPTYGFGSARCGFTGGPASGLVESSGVVADSAGNLFVADSRNQVIRKFTAAGTASVLAGREPEYNPPGLNWKYFTGTTDGTGAQAAFFGPEGLAIDAAGNLFVSDTANHSIRKVTQAGVVTTFAGTPGVPGSADGPLGVATFNRPTGIAVGRDGAVYVADTLNHTLRRITPGGVVTTYAGLPGSAGRQDGCTAAARFSSPAALALDSAGAVYVVDFGNSLIRKVTAAGQVTTVAGGVPGPECVVR